jgi:Ca2+:H+ antiporter
MAFNQFTIKRTAHTISRRDDQPWNPFRHLAWDSRRGSRRDTWSGPDIEAQRDELDSNPPIPHVQSEPGHVYGLRPQDSSTEGIANSSSSQILPVELLGKEDGLRNRVKKTEADLLQPDDSRPDDKERKIRKSGFIRYVKPRYPFTVANQLQRILLGAWINLLLLCVPAGFALRFATGYSVATFATNYIASIPLYFMADFSMTEIGYRLGRILRDLVYLSV